MAILFFLKPTTPVIAPNKQACILESSSKYLPDCVIKSHVLNHGEYYQKETSIRVQFPLYKPQKNNHCIKFGRAITTLCINGKLLYNLNGTWYW